MLQSTKIIMFIHWWRVQLTDILLFCLPHAHIITRETLTLFSMILLIVKECGKYWTTVNNKDTTSFNVWSNLFTSLIFLAETFSGFSRILNSCEKANISNKIIWKYWLPQQTHTIDIFHTRLTVWIKMKGNKLWLSWAKLKLTLINTTYFYYYLIWLFKWLL